MLEGRFSEITCDLSGPGTFESFQGWLKILCLYLFSKGRFVIVFDQQILEEATLDDLQSQVMKSKWPLLYPLGHSFLMV